ncbi:MAG: hypothetical protein AAF361_13300, partial [Bacteroidota bacterium]
GGQLRVSEGVNYYVIQRQQPANVAPLFNGQGLQQKMISDLEKTIEEDVLGETVKQQAKGAYMAICLELDQKMKANHPQKWEEAMKALQETENVVQVLFHHSPVPAAEPLRQKMEKAGLVPPKERVRLWK